MPDSFIWLGARIRRLLQLTPCILTGSAGAALFWLKTVYHTVFLTPKPSQVRILKYEIKNKSYQTMPDSFIWLGY